MLSGWPNSNGSINYCESSAPLLRANEARRIAANIAKLPEFLRRSLEFAMPRLGVTITELSWS